LMNCCSCSTASARVKFFTSSPGPFSVGEGEQNSGF
jgi:hypothetical protein